MIQCKSTKYREMPCVGLWNIIARIRQAVEISIQNWSTTGYPHLANAKPCLTGLRIRGQVTKDDVIVADKIKGADIGTTLDIENVLLVGSPEETVVGRPVVKGALVKLLVEEQTKDKKVSDMESPPSITTSDAWHWYVGFILSTNLAGMHFTVNTLHVLDAGRRVTWVYYRVDSGCTSTKAQIEMGDLRTSQRG